MPTVLVSRPHRMAGFWPEVCGEKHLTLAAIFKSHGEVVKTQKDGEQSEASVIPFIVSGLSA